MYFASDNTGPAHPNVMDALLRANDGYMSAYGTDALMDEVRAQVRATFEAPDAITYLVPTGTAANSLALATLCQPWETIFCSSHAHIHMDECNAPEFYTGGAKLTLVAGDDKITPENLRAAIEGEANRGVHGPARGPVALTNVTERGRVYSVQELAELCSIAREYALPVHLDGARFANALVTTNASPAEMSWKIGIDAITFGGTKNGLLGVEAVVFFDPSKAQEFEFRRKRAGHLFSKHRYLSAQMQAYLTGDLWRETARAANENAARLVAGLQASGVAELCDPPEANMIFVALPRRIHAHLFANGAEYNLWDKPLEGADQNEMLEARLVCDWSLSDELIDRFIALIASA
ncbi:threonine aldolase family protein [Roseobacteraceae bacterium S113]